MKIFRKDHSKLDTDNGYCRGCHHTPEFCICEKGESKNVVVGNYTHDYTPISDKHDAINRILAASLRELDEESIGILIDNLIDRNSKYKEINRENAIAFGKWYRMWYGHPSVGIDAHDAFGVWESIKNKIDDKNL